MRWPRALVLSLGLLTPHASPALSAEAVAEPVPTPVAVLKAARGFIDDPLALSADGRTLYYINTDGATWAELHTVALPAPAPPSPAAKDARPADLRPDVTLSAAPLYPLRLLPLPGERVLVVERNPETQVQTATVLAPKEPKRNREKLGPADDIVLSDAAGKRPQVILYSGVANRDKGGELKVRLVDAATLKPGAQRSLRVLPGDGGVALGGGRDAGPAVPLGLADQYLTLLARQPGAFDKKADLRQPDRLVAYDMIAGKVTQSAPLQSQGAILELATLRQRHAGETTFLAHLPERQRVELIRGLGGATGDLFLGTRTPLRWPRPFALYEAATLRYQPTPEGRLFASLTVDPVNEAAVARKKADADIIDLCGVDPDSGVATRLLAVPGNKRRGAWVAVALGGGSGSRFALLRKHKGFARGGSELEIYDVPTAPPLSAPPAPAAPATPENPTLPTQQAR